MLVQPVGEAEYSKAVDTYAGLNDANASKFFNKLAELGIIDGAG